jgi:hypothetical protein
MDYCPTAYADNSGNCEDDAGNANKVLFDGDFYPPFGTAFNSKIAGALTIKALDTKPAYGRGRYLNSTKGANSYL